MVDVYSSISSMRRKKSIIKIINVRIALKLLLSTLMAIMNYSCKVYSIFFKKQKNNGFYTSKYSPCVLKLHTNLIIHLMIMEPILLFCKWKKMRNYYDKENFISQKTCFCEWFEKSRFYNYYYYYYIYNFIKRTIASN